MSADLLLVVQERLSVSVCHDIYSVVRQPQIITLRLWRHRLLENLLALFHQRCHFPGDLSQPHVGPTHCKSAALTGGTMQALAPDAIAEADRPSVRRFHGAFVGLWRLARKCLNLRFNRMKHAKYVVSPKGHMTRAKLINPRLRVKQRLRRT